MTFQEHGLILYPYILDNHIIYEVRYDDNIREVTKSLPDLPENEAWECFGVDVDIDNGTSEVLLDIVNVY